MPASALDRRDLTVARLAIGAAAVGVVWLTWQSPAARRVVKRGAKYALVTWLPAYVASQVREAWANAAPLAIATPAPLVSSPATHAAAAVDGPAVPAFTPPATTV